MTGTKSDFIANRKFRKILDTRFLDFDMKKIPKYESCWIRKLQFGNTKYKMKVFLLSNGTPSFTKLWFKCSQYAK